jgi:hypothetical protein
MDPGLKDEEFGKNNVLLTHPLDKRTGCQLSRQIKLPAGKKSVLHLTIGHHPEGDWDLIVAVDGKEIARKTVSEQTTGRDLWMQAEVDLSDYAGKEIKLELINQPTGWKFEAGYWAEISLLSQ